MSTAVLASLYDAPFALRTTQDQHLYDCVRGILQKYRHRPQGSDRRCDRREPFPYPLDITPIAADGRVLHDETIVVLGKHLSERGLDFYYQAPLPYRRVVASWECPDGDRPALLLDLRWCRCTKRGWYENGGRFLQVLTAPLQAVDTLPTTDAGETVLLT
jgi:hypothetical protein